MIFKLKFEDRVEFAQAKSHLHLLQSYEEEFGDFSLIEDLIEVSDDEAKSTMLKNTENAGDDDSEPKEISLYDLACGNEFSILGGTDF